MKSYAGKIREIVMSKPENVPLTVKEIYDLGCSDIPETTFCKVLERMCGKEELVRLGKGLYYRPQMGRFGIIPLSLEEIISHFTENGRGILIGYGLYLSKGLTTQITKKSHVLTSVISEKEKQVEGVVLEKIDFEITTEIAATIEVLEILQNFAKIEDMNKVAFVKYIEDYSKKYYSNTVVEYVLSNRKYKKSTIAFLKELLSHMGVMNNLSIYLSPFSEYSFPSVEDIYEVA
ncbi:MAG: DUF6088 family protein [Clostridia bacterium]|nr:DUF6088 family protein [Clostridia bacterium]